MLKPKPKTIIATLKIAGLLAAISTASLITTSEVSAATFVIDTFESNGGTGDQFFTSSSTSLATDFVGPGLTNVLGDYRVIGLQRSGSPTGLTAATGDSATPLGSLALSRTQSSGVGNYSLKWDGTSAATNIVTTTNYNVDLSGGGTNDRLQFVVDTLNDLTTGSNASISVWVNGDSSANFYRSATVDLSTLTNGANLDFLFSGFTAVGTPSALNNFSNIGAIRFNATLNANTTASSNISFRQYQATTIPFEFAPGVGLAAVGGLFLGKRLLKRRRSSNTLKANS